jgi:DNA polymerase III delta subunit
MIFFLYGKNKFNINRKAKEIIQEYQGKYPEKISVEVVDLKEEKNFQFAKLKQSFQPSLFLEKRIFIIKNASLNTSFKENFLKEEEFFLKIDGILIFIEENVNKNDKLFLFFKKNAKCYQYEELTPFEVKTIVINKLKEKKLLIDHYALKIFLEYTNNNLWQIENEIEKLIALKEKSISNIISEREIKELVRPINFNSEIFLMIEKIIKKEKRSSLKLLNKEFLAGKDYVYLFSMIVQGFRNLLLLKEKPNFEKIEKIKKEFQLHPYTIKKAIELSKFLNFQEIKKIYNKFLEIDLKVKLGKLETKNALYLLITEI